MWHTFLDWLRIFPPELATMLVAMTPFIDRLALPMAIAKFHLSATSAFLFTVLGNMTPVVCVLALGENFHAWVVKHAGFFGQAWVKTIAKAQKNFARYERFGLWGLFVFVALPLPVSGPFAGAAIAFALGYPLRHSLPYLFAAVMTNCFLTLVVTLSAVKIF